LREYAQDADKHFYGHDPHDGPMSIEYFVWAAVSPDHTVVADTGLTVEVAELPGQEM
jgi:hypothetical protein